MQMAQDEFEVDIMHVNTDEDHWKRFMKVLKKEYHRVKSNQVGKVLVYGKAPQMNDFLAKAMVTSVFSEYMDKNMPLKLSAASSAMERKEKILPIDLKPEITTYLFYSTKLCIVQACPNLKEWQMVNFTNIKVYYNEKNKNNFFMEEDLEEIFCFERKSIEDMKKIDDILCYTKSALDAGWYVDIHLDEYYLSCKEGYNRRHYVHENLVYGYSDDREVVYAYGFGKNRKMVSYEIPYMEFLYAYEKGRIFYFSGASYLDGEYPYSLDLRKLRFQAAEEFTLEKFKLQLKEYICPQKEEIVNDDFHVYGINVIAFIRNCINDNNINVIDFRTFQLLYEHKKCLLNRFCYLAEKYDKREELAGIIQEYKSIVSAYQNIRLVYLRQLKREENGWQTGERIKDISVLREIEKRLESLGKEERRIIDMLLLTKNIS